MEMTAATETDIEPIVATIAELSSWLKTRGIYQWTNGFPPDWVAGEISHGELYVHREKGEVIASVVLSFKSGELWGQSEGAAMYIHRLAVKREYFGRALGREMILWAESEVRKRGVSTLRLECASDNEFLKAYYENLGFHSRGVIHHVAYKMDFALFEKQIV